MKNYILAIDQGTTGSTSLIIDKRNHTIISKVNTEFPQIFPTPGWVEHDLNSIWNSVKTSTLKAIQEAGIDADEIGSIGITNQRETTCAFSSAGAPLANAIVWQDRRTNDYCNEKRSQYIGSLDKMTGLPLDPYFSGTKMRWLLNNNDDVKKAYDSNDLKFGTIDTYLLYRITNGKSFYTESSNASRTLLYNLEEDAWDDKLCDFFEVDKNLLPEIKDSFSNFGETSGLDFLPDNIPVTCILGDQQAALFGQAGFNKGDLKCTYGTGAFILLNTGEEKIFSTQGLLTTVAYKHKGKLCYALEGSSYIAGAAVQWLRDQLQVIPGSPDVEKLANSIGSLDEMKNLMFMPFFTGIGSPYWIADAQAAIVGITRDSGRAHIARACLDGIALSINDSIQALVKDVSMDVETIKVDGGAAANNLLMQIQANFSNKTIVRPKVIETTAFGVAMGSLIGLGEMPLDGAKDMWAEDKSFTADTSNKYFQEKYQQWTTTIEKLY